MPLLWKDFAVPAREAVSNPDFKELVRQKLRLKDGDIQNVSVKKKSLDARKKSKIVYHFQLRLDVENEQSLLKEFPHLEQLKESVVGSPMEGVQTEGWKPRHKPLIIGSGPAGIFTALSLQEIGISSHIVERGEPVGKRLKTVNALRSKGIFDPESNSCFGEGGAGTFSDGKLTCGRNHPLIRYIFNKFSEFGGPENLLYDAHPHIGTDYLLKIATQMRNYLSSAGCDFSFGKIFKGFTQGHAHARYLVELNDGTKIPTDHLILAIGHSARDTYQKLYDSGLAMAPKPFAIGARIEHPQDLINEIQFGQCHFLPAAEYKLTARAGERGIWTFCMCPGGHLMPTPAQPEHLAINGMSYHARNSGFANAAVVVNVLREDFYRSHPLDGMHFQAKLEQRAFKRGGGDYFSPAQGLRDFVAGRETKGALKSTYKPGVRSERLDTLLPEFVSNSLKVALQSYDQRMKGYLSDSALVVGLESKTSAPVTLLRGKDQQSVSHVGLFPCGEGAGFAGGIVSAALDGVRTGRAVVNDLIENKKLTVHVN